MANVQITRQPVVQRDQITTTVVNQVQSLQLVQTMLHGALSMLTYSRGLFPTKAFVERFYDNQETTISYESFANGQLPVSKAEAKLPSTKVPVLMRQRSRRADQLLNWLEGGVFQELQSGQLRAVQIFIHPDQEFRHQVIETYTFTITYTTAADGQRVPSGLTTGASGQDIATTEATNVALQQLLRNLASLCEDLPNLPAKRMLSMALVYEGRSSRDRLVEGFGEDEGGDLSFPVIEGWRIGTESYELASGYHNSHLKIRGMQSDRRKLRTGQAQQLPQNLKFALSTSRFEDVPAMAPPVIPNRPDPQKDSNKARESQVSMSGSQQTEQIRSSPANGMGRTLPELTGFFENNEGTQSTITKRMNSDLERMMQPEQITQGDTQTQGNLFRSTSTRGDEDAVTATPTTIHEPPIGATETRLQSNQGAFSLKASKIQDILRRKESLKSTTMDIVEGAGAVLETGQIILCQCGFRGEEGDMVQCSVCDTWQHLHCSGYVGENDPRLPDQHFCYCCIVDPGDVASLEAIQQLALKRRALFLVCQYGMKSKQELAEMMGSERHEASELHSMIVDGKFVEAALGSHKSGYRKTGKALFVPVQDHTKLREMLETYFDPTTRVSKHYELRPNGTEIASRAAEINVQSLLAMRTDLPEPATKRHRSGEPTSSTSSDLSASESFGPFTTSALRKAPVPQGLKRKADTEDAEDAGPALRKHIGTPSTRHRFSGLQSLQLIDARGDSSPASWQGSARKPGR